MKKVTYLLFVFMAIIVLPIKLNAQDVFYVSPEGNDANPGTEAEPWLTPNATHWTDGCTVKISGEIYAITTANVLAKSVTLEGITEDAAIAALTDAAFANGITGSFQLFKIGSTTNAATLTVKNMTVKNARLSTNGILGVMFFVDILGTLNLENAVLKNCEGTGATAYGGAVYCKGKIHATNTTFENNTASSGGAVQLWESGTATAVEGVFENCIFTQNQNRNNTQYGTISMSGIVKGNFVFNKCYFNSNKPTGDKSTGGVFYLGFKSNATNIDVSFQITNSTFTNNSSENVGAAIYTHRSPLTGNLDFTIANCTFYKNTSNAQNGVVVSIAAAAAEVTGTNKFVNNTFFYNSRSTDPVDSYNATILYGQPGCDLYFVNNILLEETWTGSQGLNVNAAYKSHTVKNNIFGRVGGVAAFTSEITNPANYNQILDDADWSISPEDKAVAVGLASANLTVPADGSVPYLPIIDGEGLAVDFGTSSVLVGETNIVPQTDVADTEIYGNSRDAGAYEYTGPTTGLEGFRTISTKYPVIETRYYTLQGVEIMSQPENTGIYIVKKVDIFNNLEVKKIYINKFK